MWVGTGGEGAKAWMAWLAELKNRGVQDVLTACCDGLKSLPDLIQSIWPLADVQLCVVHMVRHSLKYVSTQHWSLIAKELRYVYTAPAGGRGPVRGLPVPTAERPPRAAAAVAGATRTREDAPWTPRTAVPDSDTGEPST
jgi:hypothetical protein